MSSFQPTTDPFLAAAELKANGVPFVLATVVRAVAPTSARPGDKAIFTKDGLVLGWVGGSCAEPIVRDEAEAVLKEGAPRLVCITPEVEAVLGRAGLIVHTMTCFSGGSLDIYLEPFVPAPQLVIFGNSPVARALVDLGRLMKYEVTVVDLGDRPPLAPEITTHRSLANLVIPPESECFAVVSSHGVYDDEALQKALAIGARYTGFITSRRRRDQVFASLAARGVPTDAIARVHAPAGLDLGAKTPEEVALSVMASIVATRRGRLPTASLPATSLGSHPDRSPAPVNDWAPPGAALVDAPAPTEAPLTAIATTNKPCCHDKHH
jgi:xanthine dehydrogenase accessory factor